MRGRSHAPGRRPRGTERDSAVAAAAAPSDAGMRWRLGEQAPGTRARAREPRCACAVGAVAGEYACGGDAPERGRGAAEDIVRSSDEEQGGGGARALTWGGC